jgi:hypothetical protein
VAKGVCNRCWWRELSGPYRGAQANRAGIDPQPTAGSPEKGEQCRRKAAERGALVISLVDNLVRQILVGADTKMPDYVVLISTLGGLEVFGMNGIVLGPVIAAMFIVVWDIFAAANRRKPTTF